MAQKAAKVEFSGESRFREVKIDIQRNFEEEGKRKIEMKSIQRRVAKSDEIFDDGFEEEVNVQKAFGEETEHRRVMKSIQRWSAMSDDIFDEPFEESMVYIELQALQRCKLGEIISRFEKKGMKILSLKLMRQFVLVCLEGRRASVSQVVEGVKDDFGIKLLKDDLCKWKNCKEDWILGEN